MKIAIDLLWVRVNKVGGIESQVRNLMDGFQKLQDYYEYILIVAEDNAGSFKHYCSDTRFVEHVCPVRSENVAKRIVWQNFHLGIVLKKICADICFEPYYCKPFFGVDKTRFVTIIHDLQANHFPEYFSKGKVLWMKLSWHNTIRSSKRVIAISDYVKKDIESFDRAAVGKTKTIYNAIEIKKDEILDFSEISTKYDIEMYNYYFTVSSLLPHKNIETLVNTMYLMKQNDEATKLIISGVGGKSRESLQNFIKDKKLDSVIQLTEFISNNERNTLYKFCKAFLFPSIYEGFGMPPVEAMYFERPVVTTKETSLYEVTQGKAVYVENPKDANNWREAILDLGEKKASLKIDISKYSKERIARQYLDAFEDAMFN